MRKIILIVLSIFIISSCTEDENPGQESVGCTIIVYPAADNDLYADALADKDNANYSDDNIVNSPELEDFIMADIERSFLFLLTHHFI